MARSVALRSTRTRVRSRVSDQPRHLDLDRARGLTIAWSDGTISFYPVAHLRRMSPSADARHLREQLASNPLTVLPASAVGSAGPLMAVDAELVGNYALRIHFSDGHETGLFSWRYLREIDPGPASAADAAASSSAVAPPASAAGATNTTDTPCASR